MKNHTLILIGDAQRAMSAYIAAGGSQTTITDAVTELLKERRRSIAALADAICVMRAHGIATEIIGRTQAILAQADDQAEKCERYCANANRGCNGVPDVNGERCDDCEQEATNQ